MQRISEIGILAGITIAASLLEFWYLASGAPYGFLLHNILGLLLGIILARTGYSLAKEGRRMHQATALIGIGMIVIHITKIAIGKCT